MDRFRNCTFLPRFLVLTLFGVLGLSLVLMPPLPGQKKESPLWGPGAALDGKLLLPHDNPWNQDISKDPVDPNSDNLIASIGKDKPLHPDFGTVYKGNPNGIPYVVVKGDQPKVDVQFTYPDESDPGPYPIPPDAPIEGGPTSKGDRHVLVLDRDNWKLYELFSARKTEKGWKAGSGADF